MASNKYAPHLLVLPEDDANRQIANGFLLHHQLNSRAVQVLPVLGGWKSVVDDFTDNHVSELRRYDRRLLLMLVDFDERSDKRLSDIKAKIPDDLIDRVFVLGSMSEPEDLKRELKMSLENIGVELSNDCAENTMTIWSHPLLVHNLAELERLNMHVKPVVFPR